MVGRFLSWFASGLGKRYGGKSVGSVLAWVLSSSAILSGLYVMVVPRDVPAPMAVACSLTICVLVAFVAVRESGPMKRACVERFAKIMPGSPVSFIRSDFAVVGILFTSAIFLAFTGESRGLASAVVFVGVQFMVIGIRLAFILRDLSRIPDDMSVGGRS